MILISWIEILTLIIIGGFIYPFIQESTCLNDCHKDTHFIEDANRTGMGIEHICYDKCVGGVASFKIKWWWFAWHINTH
jgi:hypothetical protein